MIGVNFFIIGEDYRFSWIQAPSLEAFRAEGFHDYLGGDFRDSIKDPEVAELFEEIFLACIRDKKASVFFHRSNFEQKVFLYNVIPLASACLVIQSEIEDKRVHDLDQVVEFHPPVHGDELAAFFKRIKSACEDDSLER